MTASRLIRNKTESPSETRLVEVLDAYLAAVQEGRAPTREELLAAHPELADDLATCLASLEFIRQASLSASPPVGAPPAIEGEGGESGLGDLGDFRIVREVGRGGMGVVYEAVQRSLGRRVALKVLPFAGAMDSQQLRRFRTEAQAAAHLHHTNIVPVFWIGCEQGVHYYAMQFIEGRTLADVIRELRQLEGKDRRDDTGEKAEAQADPAASALAAALSREFPPPAAREDDPPPAAAPGPPGPSAGRPPAPPSGSSTRNRAYYRSVARLGLEAAEALEHAHQEGIVHRDIKPANLMIDDRGHLWVTDFGLARLQNDSGLTITGDLLGTLRYMSPEQALGKRAYLDHRTDIYSLGATLYEVLTLRPAIEGTDRQEILAHIAQDEPAPPRRLNPAIPHELETILLKTMSKEPETRYTTTQELAEDLRRFLDDKPIRARRPTLLERAAKWSRRHRSVMATAILLLVLGTAVSIWQAVRATRAERRTATALAVAEKQRGLARQAVDEMYSQFATEILAGQPRMTPVQRRFLEKALAYYQEFAREPSADPAVRLATGRAYVEVGEIRRRLGQHALAEEALIQAIDHAKAAAGPVAATLGSRELLARALRELAMVQNGTGRLREAEQSQRQALAVCQALVDDVPGKPEFRSLVARGYNDLAVILKDSGRLQEALEAERRALDIWERLVREFPDEARFRNGLAVSTHNVGVRFWSLGHDQDAARYYLQAFPLFEALAKEFPGNLEVRNHLAQCAHNLGVVLSDKDQLREKEKYTRRAVELTERLATDFPEVAEYQHKLASSVGQLVGILHSLGRPPEEMEIVCRRAVEIREKLANRFPDVPDHQSRLGGELNNLALVMRDRGENAEAVRLLRRAISHQQAALKTNPRNPLYLRFLRNHESLLARTLLDLGDHAGAGEAAAALAQVRPNNWGDALQGAEHLVTCALKAERDGSLGPLERESAARGYVERGRSLLQAAVEHGNGDARAANDLAWFLATCPDPRFREPARAVELARRATEKAPREGNYWNTLGVAHYRAGQWEGAIAALKQSKDLRSGGDASDWLFLAMAHWKAGDKARARSWYQKAVAWVETSRPRRDELERFRTEAATLLGLADLPDDVFARP